MAKFYVGQRVRIIGTICESMQIHVGKEGVITGHSTVYEDGWYVSGAEVNAYGFPCSWGEIHLEPLTDPGREVLSWSDERCVWRPSGVEA